MKLANERVFYRLHDIIDSVDSLIIKFILFAHYFTGCDTTSAIHEFVKLAIVSKLRAFTMNYSNLQVRFLQKRKILMNEYFTDYTILLIA